MRSPGKLLTAEESIRLTVIDSPERRAFIARVVDRLQVRETAKAQRWKPKPRKSARIELSEVLSVQLRALKIPHVREVKLIPGRKFRTDIFIQPHLAIECDGATWTGGRHTRGAGVETDCEKQNLLVTFGYRPMRFTKQQIKLGRAVEWIQKAMQVNPWAQS